MTSARRSPSCTLSSFPEVWTEPCRRVAKTTNKPGARAYCGELIEALRGRDVVDGATEYAQPIPVRVIAKMLGLPESDADVFRHFVNHVLEGVALPLEQRAEGIVALFGYLQGHIEDHLANPREDLISFLLYSELDGVKLDPFQVARTIGLLLIAGIDTIGARSAPRGGTWPRPPTTASGSWPSPICSPLPWRSCCGPTPR